MISPVTGACSRHHGRADTPAWPPPHRPVHAYGVVSAKRDCPARAGPPPRGFPCSLTAVREDSRRLTMSYLNSHRDGRTTLSLLLGTPRALAACGRICIPLAGGHAIGHAPRCSDRSPCLSEVRPFKYLYRPTLMPCRAAPGGAKARPDRCNAPEDSSISRLAATPPCGIVGR